MSSTNSMYLIYVDTSSPVERRHRQIVKRRLTDVCAFAKLRFAAVALNCPSRTKDLFHAMSRHIGAPLMKEAGYEIQLSETANQESKQMRY